MGNDFVENSLVCEPTNDGRMQIKVKGSDLPGNISTDAPINVTAGSGAVAEAPATQVTATGDLKGTMLIDTGKGMCRFTSAIAPGDSTSAPLARGPSRKL